MNTLKKVVNASEGGWDKHNTSSTRVSKQASSKLTPLYNHNLRKAISFKMDEKDMELNMKPHTLRKQVI